MSVLIAGMASGALMAKMFITIWCLSFFFLMKDPPPALTAIFERVSPTVLTMGIAAAAYPVWGIIGVVMALLFTALENAAPNAGLGSPNLAYTLGICAASVALTAPIAIVFRRVWIGLAATAISAAAIFGWLTPFLAT